MSPTPAEDASAAPLKAQQRPTPRMVFIQSTVVAMYVYIYIDNYI